MKTRTIIALACSGTVSSIASAQPGTRNAIVYGARAVGEANWHFGSISLESSGSTPITFEVGVFFFRAQGYALSSATYKTYINDVSAPGGDSAPVVEDPTNGTPPNGVDGRVGVWASEAQTQSVFTNRNASIGGTGFRISSSADGADASAAGGIRIKQAGPVGGTRLNTDDGVLGFRFNVTVARAQNPRDVLVFTPTNRINSFTTYNSFDSNSTTEWKSTVVVDAVTLTASWIPSPASLILPLIGLLPLSGRRRR